ncbi:MAG: alpha/beta hydrolase [Myxococcales bacterium]|nr:alpha/beta hydrolase [Myxococcales bacterium]
MPLRLVFLHGLESGPHGSKFQTLSGLGLGDVLAPDCTGLLDVQARLEVVTAALPAPDRYVLVGSSFGGLMAVLYAAAQPTRVAGLVLLAPAVHLPEKVAVPPVAAALAVQVLHGDADDIVPLAAVQLFCVNNRLPLKIVADGHRLGQSHDVMATLVHQVWQSAQAAAV